MMPKFKYDNTGLKSVGLSGQDIYMQFINFKFWCYSAPTYYFLFMPAHA